MGEILNNKINTVSDNHSYSNIQDIADVLMIVEHSGVNNSRRTDNGLRNFI